MAENLSGVNPFAALLSGMVQGGGEQFLQEQQEQRMAQFNAARILLNAGIQTGQLGSLAGIIDPKFLKSMGLTPEVIGQVDQLLEPVRQQLQAQQQLTQAQTGVAQAAGRRGAAEAGMIEKKAGIIEALPPEQQTQVLAPEIGEAQARQAQAEAAKTGAAASMMRAEKDLSFEQQMQMLDKKLAGELEQVKTRATTTGRDEADRALQQRFSQAKQNWRQAMNSFLQITKPDPQTGEKLFASQEEAANAVSVYNGAAAELNQVAMEMARQYGGEPSLVPLYGVEPVTSWPFGTTSGYRAKPMAGAQAPSAQTMQQQGQQIDLGNEEEIMRSFKKKK